MSVASAGVAAKIRCQSRATAVMAAASESSAARLNISLATSTALS